MIESIHDLASDPKLRELLATIPIIKEEAPRRGRKPGSRRGVKRRSQITTKTRWVSRDRLEAITRESLGKYSVTIEMVRARWINEARNELVFALRKARVPYSQISALIARPVVYAVACRNRCSISKRKK